MVLKAGAGQVDLTPHPGLPMAGYSTMGQLGQGYWGRLFARALFLEDSAGERVAICVLDLMSASRTLWENTAQRTARSCGIDRTRLILAGTHTHHAPGNFYGNSLYDALAQARPGFDQGLADWLSEHIAEAVTAAAQRAEPATVGIASSPLWGVSQNASLAAFQRNPEAEIWNQPGFPGRGAPSYLSDLQRAVDPTVTAIVAVANRTRRPLGIFGCFACHATALGPKFGLYSPDWMGFAAQWVRTRVQDGGEPPLVVGILAGAGGDVNALTVGPQGKELVRKVGTRVGSALADAALDAAANSQDVAIRVLSGEMDVTQRTVAGRSDTELASSWHFGAPSLGGQQDGPSILAQLGVVRAGMVGRFFPSSHPQHPKRPVLGRWQPWLLRLLPMRPSPCHPLHVLSLGDHCLATVPGEPTTALGFRISQAIRDASDAKAVTVVGYAGDYGGYFTTPEEYDAQHYEGASMLWGRNAGSHIVARLARITCGLGTVDGEAPTPDDTKRRARRFLSTREQQTVECLEPRVNQDGSELHVEWKASVAVPLHPAQGPLLGLEEWVEGCWRPVQKGPFPFDDQHLFMEVERHRSTRDRMQGTATWRVRMTLPDQWKKGGRLRVRLMARKGSAGHVVLVPQ